METDRDARRSKGRPPSHPCPAQVALGADGDKKKRKGSVDHVVDVDGAPTGDEEEDPMAFELPSETEKKRREAANAAAGLPPGVELGVEDPFPDQKPNELHVVLMRASNLQVMDKSLFGRGSSDPYVTSRAGRGCDVGQLESAPLSVASHACRPIFGRGIISRTRDCSFFLLERSRAAHPALTQRRIALSPPR